MKHKTTHILLGCLLLPFLGNAQWSVQNISAAREELAACRAGNKLLFAGGFSGTPFGNSKRVDIYDLTTGAWSVDSLSEARDEMSAASWGNLAFFVGSSGLGNLARIMDIYDAATGTWTQQILPNAEYIKAIAANGNKVFVAGGDYIDIYDIATGQWTSHPLTVSGNSNMAGASVGTKVMFAGGYGSKTVEVYDVVSGMWTTNMLSEARRSIRAVTLGTKAYFAGGVKDNYDASKTIDIYDAATDSWSVQTLTTGRSAMGITALNGKIYFAGGRGNNGSGFFNSVEIYNTVTNEWTTDQLSVGRHSLAAISANGKVYFAGGLGSAGSQNIIDVYDDSVNAADDIQLPVSLPDFYPNPCHNTLNIQWSDPIVSDVFDIYVYNSAGQLLRSVKLPKQPILSLPVDDMPPGIYMLKLNDGSKFVSKMFVKE